MTAPDPLAEIRDQLRAATDAAERLVRDARPGPPGPGRGPGRPDAAQGGGRPDAAGRGPARPDAGGRGPGRPGAAARGPGRPDATGRGAGRPDPPGRGPGRPDTPGRGPGRPDATGPAPPAGWQAADEGSVPPELLALARLLGVLREILPPELHHQVTDLIRQLLVLLRGLIDWAVTHLEQEGPGREVEVEDIRID